MNMTDAQWILVASLALGAYSIRFLGLVSGQIINENKKLHRLLQELPSCLIIALIASSLSDANTHTLIAAAIACFIAIISNNVVITMSLGLITYILIQYITF